jgi:hypothetical protein
VPASWFCCVIFQELPVAFIMLCSCISEALFRSHVLMLVCCASYWVASYNTQLARLQ